MVLQDEIFVVEDNPDDIFLLVEGFKNVGDVSLKFFENGSDALVYIKENKASPSVILLDLNLPDMDGKELLTLLKKDEEMRKIPVVVFTTSNAPSDISFCLSHYANSYLIKPLEFEKLVEMLEAIYQYWIKLNAKSKN